MKISKKELIKMGACEDSLQRFIEQTVSTNEPVNVADLVGGKNTYSDLLWLAGKTLPRERIVRFACDCALINIERIKPYTDKYDLIVGLLHNPNKLATDVARAAANAAYATCATDAARAAANAGNKDAVDSLLRYLFSQAAKGGMMKCNYYRESEIEQYVPSCSVEDGFAFNYVHPYDVDKYCQYCGGKIKAKEFTRHPDLNDRIE